MIALAIETSTAQSSVALGNEQGVMASASLSWGRGHSEVVVPAIHQLLEWAELEPSQIGGVAVGIGPGLFTGLRVGVSTARTLAQVLGVPIVGIGSLDIAAYSVRHSRWRIGSVLDAKRGEVFYAFYRPVPGGVTRETPAAVGAPDELAAELVASGEETLLVGNGALLYERELSEAGSGVEFASASLAFPSATALLELAVPRFHREETSAPRDVVPVYVRRSDAEINWSRRARSA
ncbi:MAG TPA: tRNA (adenosine(37)-N6)-threonylcarbamoyltransferase complex dimerization subunit type 1 TsaB [Actinomycetota bacterium]|nr:tRNA (adenosine(37)-N6)-threonylcarbamoyltransferase complex dimerization subunit type 1 TsaB [Actinomycetota bacterium]